MNLFSYILTFLEGILTFISPCILPMLPIYFFYLAGSAGVNEGETKDNSVSNRKTLLKNSMGFVFGFTIVFILLGVTVTSFGHLLTNNRGLMRKISGAVMILFGLNFMGILNIKRLSMEKRMNFKVDKLNFLSSIVFGLVFGFGWTPCIGAFLGSALVLAGNSKTIIQGVMLLVVYSIGLGIPFIVSSIIFDRLKGAFKQLQKHSRVINIVSGVVLVTEGILVFSDSLKYLDYFLK